MSKSKIQWVETSHGGYWGKAPNGVDYLVWPDTRPDTWYADRILGVIRKKVFSNVLTYTSKDDARAACEARERGVKKTESANVIQAIFRRG